MISVPPSLVVFDVCDTLYECNTTVGFIRHYAAAEQNRRIERVLNRWLDRGSPFFYLGAILHRLAGHDIARMRLIASLAGEPRARLATVADDYARQSLPGLANAAVHKRFDRHRAAGERVVLVSSSVDLAVEPIAELLGVEYCASTMEFADGVCTGRLTRDLTGKKAAVVRDLAGGQPFRLTVYTDNQSDRELVAMADEATIIIPREAAGYRWAGGACEYLEL